MPLYVAKDRDTTVISRAVLRVTDGRRVRRSWDGLVEDRVPEHHTRTDPTMAVIGAVGLPPVFVMLAAIQYLGLVVAVVTGGLTLLLTSTVASMVHRRRASGSLHTPGRPGGGGRRRPAAADARPPSATADVRTLTAVAECTAFDRAVATADRIAGTWPALGELIDVLEASTLLTEALWEISGVLARHQELAAVLAELTRPDFAGLSPAGGTAAKLQAQIHATKEALLAVELDLAAREASLRRAEEAGRTFIREREMLQAIRAAERSLSTPPDPALSASAAPDPAADLAEHTQLVLTAYRELTTLTHPDDGPA